MMRPRRSPLGVQPYQTDPSGLTQSPYLTFDQVSGSPLPTSVLGEEDDAPSEDIADDGLPAHPLGTEPRPAPPPEQQQEEPQSYPSADEAALTYKAGQQMAGERLPVHGPWEAAANAVNQILGTYQEKKAQRQIQEAQQRRQAAMRKAIGGGTQDLTAIADAFTQSDDPELVDKGLELKLQIAAQQAKRGQQAPTVHDFIRGDTTAPYQWDQNTQSWQKIPEMGGPRYKPTAAGGAIPSFSDDAITILADRALAGDPGAFANLSRANGGAQLRQLMERIATRGKELGMKNDDIGRALSTAKGQFAGFMQGERTGGQIGARVGQAAAAAFRMGKIARAANLKVPRGRFVPLNRALQMIQRGMSNPELAQLYAATNSFVQAYSRAVTPVGAPTDAKQAHAWEMLNGAQSPQAYGAVMDILEQEMNAETEAASQTPEDLSTSFNQRPGVPGEPKPATEAAPAAAPPDFQYDAQGRRIKK